MTGGRWRRALRRRSMPTTDVLAEVCTRLTRESPTVTQAMMKRATELAAALSSHPPAQAPRPVSLHETMQVLAGSLTPLDHPRAWLMRAVLTARLPDCATVRSDMWTARLDGTAAVLSRLLDELSRGDGGGTWPAVRVVVGVNLVDVHHTCRTDFATGIQRVTREVTRRWCEHHQPTLIGWHDNLSSIRLLSREEALRAQFGGPPVESTLQSDVLVPWKCTYILPELAAEVERAAGLQALAEYSGSSLNLIGYDLVPITTAETSHEGLVPGFARNLATSRYARIIVPISKGAAEEYIGWRSMLAGTGLDGPRIEPVVLPTEITPSHPRGIEAARRRLLVGALPMVLVVGSHEPRKNHEAILHAAELLWREGLLFSLTFIGGNSWNSNTFVDTVDQLRSEGRPVETIAAASDELLWGGYQLARFTVFPSINEGYGLPVAESLSCGTPVVTSNYGSMKEIVDAGGGALTVNPRDDRAIADGMRILLTDDARLAELSAQAKRRPIRTWDQYADQTWALLAGSE